MSLDGLPKYIDLSDETRGFHKGDRVRYSQAGLGMYSRNRDAAAKLIGTVSAEPKNQSCAQVTWDGGKTARHRIVTNYLEHVDAAVANR